MNDPPPLCERRSVYLNFEGQKMLHGSSDATQDPAKARWMQSLTGEAPRYLDNDSDSDRDAAIQTIVTGVTKQLSQFPIDVVTRRPPLGNNYVMIVFGGQSGEVGSNYGGAVNQLDCGDQQPNDVAWISDDVTPPQLVINYAIGAIGFGLGLTATNDPNDCMCGWTNGNRCRLVDTVACKLSSQITRDLAAAQTCQGAMPQQDEVATFRKAFCE